VESSFVIPPWLLTVDIVGHTCDNNKTIYPHMEIDKKSLVSGKPKAEFICSMFNNKCSSA